MTTHSDPPMIATVFPFGKLIRISEAMSSRSLAFVTQTRMTNGVKMNMANGPLIVPTAISIFRCDFSN